MARKKGLDGLYEQADGSPKPKKVEEPRAPVRSRVRCTLLCSLMCKCVLQAPGTFGWDHSKYRPPPDDIQKDEFGRPVERIAEEDGEQGTFGNHLYPPTE